MTVSKKKLEEQQFVSLIINDLLDNCVFLKTAIAMLGLFKIKKKIYKKHTKLGKIRAQFAFSFLGLRTFDIDRVKIGKRISSENA